ncbi:light-regulated signal transduction histidine kinase (bacteriophytochrome)/CheY-like chemotaxis protein [Bosea sp. BE271]|uniref:HWE histidine kinase domain-containing protein n=1 Tax=Bosea TaxID=85413 RepID=UPI002864B8A2|nr:MULTISPECIES: HWE histidine kinase domain-containing protein [Bosea]MDR6827193.1 light-regulated signal transduction histidine kinase (bacteriophytochrome)/CheY-like chemotaxis protein [Bosea robiniae]MDR6893903.1 light-regulated signal transduction histidine kinase (bacteriophytochrome)/CheY-like chemotaxis protein [Bosea sp. BE109]MDR7136397.1 light-regulated signal transduction histidine kinase (bacteriophytochrome)/CheY-like chemotaxis protein [Bosea sp. BE168]MDR7173096.1 light-regulate
MTTVDLTNCDREPIHIPGSVQPHGCMIVCDAEAVTIRRHSSNASAFLGLGEFELVGRRLEEVLGGPVVHEMRNALARSGVPSRAGLMPRYRLPALDREFDISIHAFKGNAIIEFEESVPAGPSSPLEFARTLVGRLSDVTTPAQLIKNAARLLRAVLQYDRVMIYQFAPDGSGKVVSEAKRPGLESFMGQHFPASDIPQQARQLYLLNPIRVVSDASGERFPITPVLDAAGEPLDLSYAHLRSVSPIHCEYLRNMGVSASMSVSIIVDGALWGLIACHHYSPRSLSMNRRIAAEIFGEFFALQLGALTQKQMLLAAEKARDFLNGLLSSAAHVTDASSFLGQHLAEFRNLVESDGVGVWVNGEWRAEGSAPPAEFAEELAAFAGSVCEGRIWATTALAEALPSARIYADAFAGMLAIPLSQIPRDYLFFFRKELVHTIEWGGDPNKTYKTGPHGDRLTPRQSFAVWKETVAGHSKIWTPVERELAESARRTLIEVVLRQSELLADERNKAEIRQKMLNQELNHRVKNILALIKSIVAHPLAEGATIEAYVTSLKGRIEALAIAHDQAMRASGGGSLLDLVNAEASPYRTSDGTITVRGPSVALDARAFSVVALVIHELITNAAKYGALSVKTGALTVDWSTNAGGDCEIVWKERGGPPVRPPSRQGFGSILIDRSIPYDLGGRSDLAFEPEGVTARLCIPAKFIRWTEDAASPEEAPISTRSKPGRPLEGRSVLLVEDQFIIAMDCEDMLATLGASQVEVCANVSEALSFLGRTTPDLAILDVNLGSETSEPIGNRLRELGVPFLFATGYDDLAILGVAEAATLRKPYNLASLEAALRRLPSVA